MPAPLPPMFAFTTTGKRSPSLASTAFDAWLMTRARGYGRPSDSSSVSCRALEISTSNPARPFTTGTPSRSRWAMNATVKNIPCTPPRSTPTGSSG